MFHVKQITKYSLHELLFYLFLFLIPIQTRILYRPEVAYIDWYFNYNLAFFFYLSDIVLITCLVSWLVLDKPWYGLTMKRLFWLILAFFSIIMVSLLHVKHLNLAWFNTLKWLELLLLVLYISQTFKDRFHFTVAGIILFTSAVFQALLGLFQFHMQHALHLGFLGEYIAPLGSWGLATIETGAGKVIRAYGTFPHPNVYGAFLVLGLTLGFFLVSRATKWTKIALTLGLYIILLGLFVSFSRIAWLTSLLVFLSFMIYYWKRDRKTLAVIISIALVSCATILLLSPHSLKARVSDTNSASVSDRYFFNNLGLDLIEHFPVLGVGAGSYVPALRDASELEAWQYQPAHNIFIFLAAELGLLGLILFLAILWKIFSFLKIVPRETLPFALTCLGIIFLLMGQFDHYFVTIQQGRLMFFTMLGLIAALPNIYAEKSN